MIFMSPVLIRKHTGLQFACRLQMNYFSSYNHLGDNMKFTLFIFIFISICTDVFPQWTLLRSPVSSALNSLSVSDSSTVTACGDKGTIIRSTDGGDSWNVFITDTSQQLYSICFTDRMHGWAAGTDTGGTGVIYNTTDGGQNWQKNFVTSFDLRKICFWDSKKGWAAGNGTKVIRTIDAGATWNLIDIGEGKIMDFDSYPDGTFCFLWMKGYVNGTWGIFSMDDNSKITPGYQEGYNFIEGAFGTGRLSILDENNRWFYIDLHYKGIPLGASVYRIFDNGDSCSVISSLSPHLSDIFFSDSLNGWTLPTSMYEGITSIYRTRNGGKTWTDEGPPITFDKFSLYNLTAIRMTDTTSGYAVGTDGRVLKYSKTTSVSEWNSENLHQRLIIEQNYPNPFNPSTRISYTLPESGRITLKVFDLLGKEVASLLDEYQEAGDHDIEFNTRIYNIPSGIYFYRLQTGKLVQTRKMLLLK